MIPKRYATIAILALITLLVIVSYANSLNGTFIWDDIPIIRDNAFIRTLSGVGDIFTNDVGAGGGRSTSFYRPLYLFTYSINYYASGLNIQAIHLSNIILHILVSIAIFFLIKSISNDRLIAGLTGVLFAVHPVHTEVVSYMSGRVDSLVTLFLILSVISYIKYRRSVNPALLLAVLVSYAMAILSKENALLLPFILILYHRAFDREKDSLRNPAFILVIAMSLVYIFLRFTVLRFALASPPDAHTFLERIPGFFTAIFNYIRILLLPIDLHMEYGTKLFAIFSLKAIFGIIVTALLISIAKRKRKSDSLIFFSISWFFITLLPVSNLYPIAFYMSEHYLYLPSIGFFALLSHLLVGLYRRRAISKYILCLIVGIIAIYSISTIRQNAYWRDPVYFFERTLIYAPDSARIHNNLANSYKETGDIRKASEFYKKAIELDPKNGDAYNNLAIISRQMGRTGEAIRMYNKAIEADPNHPDVYANLATAYYLKGKVRKSIELYKKAITINPNRAAIYYNLGVAYDTIDMTNDSLACYIAAARLDPYDADIHNNLGNAYRNNGEIKNAVESYKKAIKLNPGIAAPYKNLSVIYMREGKEDISQEYLKKAKALGYGAELD